MTDKESKKPKKKTSFKKELRDWAVILSIFGILYLTGWHTEVVGKLQSVLLFTGILQPDTELKQESARDAYYDMPLVSLDGTRTSLSSFKGETVFLNFWATWCPPCIAEMPGIQKLYDSDGSDNIRFVMVSLDEDRQKARDFISRKEFTFPVYFLNGRKPAIYNSTVIPTTYVISPKGDIVMEHRGMAKYNTSDFKNFLAKVSSGTVSQDSLK